MTKDQLIASLSRIASNNAMHYIIKNGKFHLRTNDGLKQIDNTSQLFRVMEALK
jgi:hypothetical protein